MRRILTLLAATLLSLSMVAGSAASFEEHGHMLLQRPVVEFLPEGPDGPGVYLVDFRKCVDLAGGQALHLGAHHQHVHFGQAGVALFEEAGHVAVPVAPFPEPFEEALPWTGCGDFEAALPFLIPEE